MTTKRTIAEMVADKDRGIDCSAEESADIKGYFDAHPPISPEGHEVAMRFPLESDEWFEERERGDR